MELPKEIKSALVNNKTSLGDNPALPPEEEVKFTEYIVGKHFNEVCDAVEYKGTLDNLKKEMNDLISEARKIEDKNREALEKLCIDIVNKIMPIPKDTVNIEAKLTGSIDRSNERLVPEKTEDFTFDSIKDMKYLTDEIYKRRVLDCLITGAAMYYGCNFGTYVSDLFSINPKLPFLYKQILDYNNVLMFYVKESSSSKGDMDAGKVEVNITGNDKASVSIKAEAVLFPILVEETIKGILELAISHGLPKKKEKALYVMKKSDFRLAELWDLRLGIPLWNRFTKIFKELDIDEIDLGINFILMMISTLNPKQFNMAMNEIFANTSMGKEILQDLCEKIEDGKERDEFDNYMDDKKNHSNQINDSQNNEYTANELYNESKMYGV